MRTGTRTVRAVSLMTSPLAMIFGRCSRTASRTFSSCRSQSRAPRENRSYHLASPRELESSPLSAMSRPSLAPLLLGQQCRDVAQRFLGAVLIVTILLDESLLDHGYLLPRLIIGPRGRGHQPQHVAALLEQVLLD